MRSTALGEAMDITNMLNRKGFHAHQQQQPLPGNFLNDQNHYPLIKGESAMERSVSPHGSEHSHYSNAQHMRNGYNSPSAMQASIHLPPTPLSSTMGLANFPDVHGLPNMGQMNMQHMGQQQHMQPHQHQQLQGPPQSSVKAYPCSTCGKGFARRSDLARHERIHSGHRPHACDFPNCGKQFIQRSALTVHKRVHTGEKPHHCETCAKPFSDSSSLARHRRTHSGKRPYKCPYADCQKTFTRRTTLTRHQNHHSGTIEEAAAATAAILAASKVKGTMGTRSDGDHMSVHGSPMTTPSPGQRAISMSPSLDMGVGGGLGRHSGDFQYMQQNNPLPPHLRIASPASTTSTGFNPGIRPTSHPTSYGPPPTLEPNVEPHQSGSTSTSSSPHMGHVGWQSPPHMHSPTHNGAGYGYADAGAYQPNSVVHNMYYGGTADVRRPQSAESGMSHMH